MSTETDLEDAAEKHLAEQEEAMGGAALAVNCPKTGEAVIECEQAFDFAGYPETVFWKTLAQREMSAADYVSILKSGEEGFRCDGFTSKAGKKFGARVQFNADRLNQDGEPSPGCEFVFDQPKTLALVCPLSGEPVIEREKYFQFPGMPDLRCWKTVARREVTAAEYAAIIKDGSAAFTGFKSKKTGKKFDATLKLIQSSERPGPGEGKPAIDFDFAAK